MFREDTNQGDGTHPDRLRSSCQVVYLITNNEQIIINQRKSASKKIINQRQSAKISVNIFLLFFQRKSASNFIFVSWGHEPRRWEINHNPSAKISVNIFLLFFNVNQRLSLFLFREDTNQGDGTHPDRLRSSCQV